jgi:zinc/manganese transport system substrate-binding protein
MYKTIISFLLLLVSTSLYAKTIEIVAGENFYGDIAKQIGGKYVTVTNILSNPNQDPHLFSSSPSTARSVAAADLVISSGIGYDAWMQNLLHANNKQPKQIVVADLLGKKPGDNPHIWYDPITMSVYANQLVKELSQLNPEQAQYYQQRLSEFNKQYNLFAQNVARLKQQYRNAPIIATEPVFNYMADALGLKMYGQDFQLSIMNEVEPTVSATRDFEDKLTKRMVKVLIYNNQVTNPVTERLKNLAKNQGIAVVGVSETQPAHEDYWTWMNHELVALEKALQDSIN